MAVLWTLCCCLAAGLVTVPVGDAARILMVGDVMISHMKELSSTGAALVELGHEVYLLAASTLGGKERFTKDGINIIEFNSENLPLGDVPPADSDEFQRFTFEGFFANKGPVIMQAAAISKRVYCERALADEKLFEQLRALKFDMAVADRMLMSYCWFLFPYLLKIPYVTQASYFDQYMAGAPTLPSFISPGTSFGPPLYTDQKTFYQRLRSVFFQLFIYYNEKYDLVGVCDSKVLRKYAPEVRDWQEIIDRSLLFFAMQDNAIIWAHPKLPNIVMTPSLNYEPPKRLPPDFERIVNDTSTDGVIVLSLGSLGSILPTFFVRKMLNAFSRVNYTVIWRLIENKLEPPLAPGEVPANVHLVSWMPQVHILGHPRARIFIGHGGSNGQYDAYCNGVPVIVIPFFADQHYNGFRAAQRGLGLVVESKTLTPERLIRAIEKIGGDESFYTNARHVAEIMKDNPVDAPHTIAFWIDHILKHGHEHLRSAAMDLSWYEYFMIDVIACLLVAAAVAVAVFIKCLKMIFKCVCGRCSD